MTSIKKISVVKIILTLAIVIGLVKTQDDVIYNNSTELIESIMDDNVTPNTILKLPNIEQNNQNENENTSDISNSNLILPLIDVPNSNSNSNSNSNFNLTEDETSDETTINELITTSLPTTIPVVINSEVSEFSESNNNNNNNENNENPKNYNKNVKLNLDRPMNCSDFEKLRHQPLQSKTSRLRKCCPHGENLRYDDNGQNQSCGSTNSKFQPEIITATLYQNCIEDDEIFVELETAIGNPCNVSFIYGKGEQLYVLQDGSLLIMDEFGNSSYEISDEYCLDADEESGELYAIVCVSSIDDHLGRSQTILFAGFMLVSIPCLCVVSFFHFSIKALRTIHGLSLGCLSICLAVGFFLHSVAQLAENYKSQLGYAVQFFMLSYFFWLLALCSNIVWHVWVYIRLHIPITRRIRYSHFIMYFIIAFTIPLSLVLVTKSKGLPGMPSYFFQGFTESIRESQRYFIPPATLIILTCFMLLICAFFGFRHIEQKARNQILYRSVSRNGHTTEQNPLPIMDNELFDETKKDAKCICFLFIIISITWILEIVTFYSPGPEDYLAFMEIINGLQGVFILMIFIGIRRRRDIIMRWWHDRGSHNVTEVEMKIMSGPRDTKSENGGD